LHVLVPAGAWSKENHEWHAATSTYLFPVKALNSDAGGKEVSRPAAEQESKIGAKEHHTWFCCYCQSTDTTVIQQVRGWKERPRLE